MLLLKISEVRNDMQNVEYKKKISELKKLPVLISEALREEKNPIAKDIYESKGSMFLAGDHHFQSL